MNSHYSEAETWAAVILAVTLGVAIFVDPLIGLGSLTLSIALALVLRPDLDSTTDKMN